MRIKYLPYDGVFVKIEYQNEKKRKELTLFVGYSIKDFGDFVWVIDAHADLV